MRRSAAGTRVDARLRIVRGVHDSRLTASNWFEWVGRRGRRRSRCAFFVAISALLVGVAPGAAGDVAEKTGLEAAVASRADLLWDAARKVWDWAEPGYQETKSSALLASIVEEEGFSVERGVAGIPTSFVASYGSGGPIVAILAEFDALPGLSQEAVPTRSPRDGPDWGHACGHHLFGAGSVGAALAVADGIRSGAIRGTVRLFGTPAEEGGGAKAFMARAGLFDDVDAVLHWHPGDVNSAGDPTNLARVAAKFRYRGRSAHAAASPEAGRSALDAVAILNYGAELLREHTPDRTRIHHVITAGGDAPNVVPAFAEAYYYVRHPDIDVARSIYDRLVLVAEGAAHATETELEIEFLGGIHNLLPNDTLSKVSLRNFEALIDMKYSDEERGWARKLQESLLKPRPLASVSELRDDTGNTTLGSTDVGDVSWVAPTTGIRTACWVPGTPAHSWQAVAAGGTTIGRQGMLMAARVLAATAWDLLADPSIVKAAREELDRRLADRPYRAALEEGQQPPLDYRKPPER